MMIKKVHGHEVMKMMLASGKAYTIETLVREIVDTFGKDSRFYTCSAENMTADELVSFLDSKGKFLRRKGGFQTAADKMCDH
jgi:probable metal-binding protein